MLRVCLSVGRVTPKVIGGFLRLISWDNEKKHSEEMQTLRAGVVRQSQNFHPVTDPLPGAQEGQNLISWRWSLPLSTNPVW